MYTPAQRLVTGMDPTYPLVPIANLVTCLLALLPLSTFTRRSLNVAIIAFSLWVAVASLITAVDTLAWSNNSTMKLVAWCDISGSACHASNSHTDSGRQALHIASASSVSIPACSFAITWKLFKITHLRQTIPTRRKVCIPTPVNVVSSSSHIYEEEY